MSLSKVAFGIRVDENLWSHIKTVDAIMPPVREDWESNIPYIQGNKYNVSIYNHSWVVEKCTSVKEAFQRLVDVAGNSAVPHTTHWIKMMWKDLGARSKLDLEGLWTRLYPNIPPPKKVKLDRLVLPFQMNSESPQDFKLLQAAAMSARYFILLDWCPEESTAIRHEEANVRTTICGFSKGTHTHDQLLEAITNLRDVARVVMLNNFPSCNHPSGTYSGIWNMMRNLYTKSKLKPWNKEDYNSAQQKRSVALKFCGQDEVVNVRLQNGNTTTEIPLVIPTCIILFTVTRNMVGFWGRRSVPKEEFDETLTVCRAEMVANKCISRSSDIDIDESGGARVKLGGRVLEPFLHALQADPLNVMKGTGRTVGFCAVCGKQLTTEKSKSLGVGPECSKTFKDIESIFTISDIVADDAAPENKRARMDIANGDETPMDNETPKKTIVLSNGETITVPPFIAERSAVFAEEDEVDADDTIIRGVDTEGVKKTLEMLEKLCKYFDSYEYGGRAIMQQALLTFQESCLAFRLFEWLFVNIAHPENIHATITNYIKKVYIA